MQLTAAAVTPPAEHAARRPAGRRTRPQLTPALASRGLWGLTIIAV